MEVLLQMGFKTVKNYNEERFGGMFILRNDGDSADVIFLYRNMDDVLVADTHYIKSPEYSGYVHCCGRGCPACAKGIRVQTKLFIPVYNLTENQLQFWDRSMQFEPQLNQDVFAKYPNPSEFVFRITRKGAPRDVNTTYSIMAVAKNTELSYDKICADNNTTFPEHYSKVCKDISSGDLYRMINSSNTEASTPVSEMPSYSVTPRGVGNRPVAVPEAGTPLVEGLATPTSSTPLDTLDPSCVQDNMNVGESMDEVDPDVVF